MNKINNIFSKDKLITQSNAVQKVRYNREHLLKKEVAQELNTYLNFGVFPTYADTAKEDFIEENGKLVRNPKTSGVGTPGVRSIFNRAGAVIVGSTEGDCTNIDVTEAHDWRIANNVPLIDSPENRKKIRKTSGCTIKELVEASSVGAMGRETYAYSDFMYCKHLGKVSNNYMITLRRFPLPVDDFIGAYGIDYDTRSKNSSNNASSIGCMVTWMGVSGNDLSNILKYSYSMPFKEEEAERQDRKDDADQHATVLNGMFSVFDSKYREQYQAGYAGEAANAFFNHLGIRVENPPYKNYYNETQNDRTKVYGPVDSIRKTYMRDDKGLEFNQTFSLVFEYELRSYNGINAKQAMLDLISNILNVTYTTGSFWGGGYKGFAAHQNNIFANLNVFKTKGGFTNFMDDFANDLSDLNSKFLSKITFKDILNTLNNIGGMLISGVLNKMGRPQKVMYNALLSPAPIGFWHVTIGNPKKPIMTIGNMIIKSVEIEHQGPLGLDDFPTGLKVTVQLDRGKPRDLRDIEKLYMQGNDRIYSSMGEKVFDMYKNAELYKSSRTNKTSYNPVSNIATIDLEAKEPTVKINQYSNVLQSMKKYFGTDDAFSIYIPAAEQEYGAGKTKPSTKNNDRVVGKENGK